MKIFKGQKAVDFTVNDIYGNEIKLSNYRGKKILLGFFRNVSCPFCNLRVHELKKMKDDLDQKGLRMIFFFESKPDLLKQSIFHTEVSPIPLVGDPQKTIYSLYGVEPSLFKAISTVFKSGTMDAFKAGQALNLPKDNEATQTLLPADFLIDEDFNIVNAYYGKDLRGHIPIAEIKAFVGL